MFSEKFTIYEGEAASIHNNAGSSNSAFSGDAELVIGEILPGTFLPIPVQQSLREIFDWLIELGSTGFFRATGEAVESSGVYKSMRALVIYMSGYTGISGASGGPNH